MKRQWGWLFLTILVLFGYFAMNHTFGPIHHLSRPLDAKLPVWPILVWPYLLFLPLFGAILLIAFWQDQHFTELAQATIVTFLVAYAVYLCFTAEVLRPAVTGTDLSSQLLAWLYRHDLPYASFPSLHNAGCALLITYAWSEQLRSRVWLTIFCLIVIAATVLLKQHYLADLISGLALGGVVGWYFLIRPSQLVTTNKNR